MNSTNQNKIASYAILNALERILILKELDKESVFNEYKEWIINDYKKRKYYLLGKILSFNIYSFILK